MDLIEALRDFKLAAGFGPEITMNTDETLCESVAPRNSVVARAIYERSMRGVGLLWDSE
jgi:hypothetical protein